MRIAVFLPTYSVNDAVGNDVRGMTRSLRDRGHDVRVFAQNSNVDEPVLDFQDLPRMMNHPDDVLVYHHSIACEWGVEAIERLPSRRKVVRYHNITPPKFFSSTDKLRARLCEQGIRETVRLAKTDARFWCDSQFNGDHVRELCPNRKTSVLPVFHHADELLAVDPDDRSIVGLDDWSTNILLVGRVVPNKNIDTAVQAFADYRQHFDPESRLIIVGDRPVLEYAATVDEIIRRRGIESNVLVTGMVTLPQLKALYLIADALLVTSHHEGFCVPLIEAMGLRLPVVAIPNTAVPFTGGDAVRYAESDPASIARTLDALLTDPRSREELIVNGWERYSEEFANSVVEQKLERLLTELIAST